MSSQVANTSAFKYTREFLMTFQNRVPRELDQVVLDCLRPLRLNKGNPFPREGTSEEQAKSITPITKSFQKKPRTTKKVDPNGQKARLPLAPLGTNNTSLTTVVKQPVISTPNQKSMMNKENVAGPSNTVTRKASATVQKPLQTVKPVAKSVFSPTNNATLVIVKLPALSPPLMSPEPNSPIQDVELSPSQRETDPHRLSQRQKQITYGYRTLGYLRYRLLVPRDKRKKEHPRTPRKVQICSKRSWDGQVKKWRRELHKWDPEPGSGFEELLTADILESIFEGVPDITDLIKGLKEKLAQGKIGEVDDEDEEEFASPLPHQPAAFETATLVAKTLVF